MFKRVVANVLVLGMAATAPPAHAMTTCSDRESVVTQLSRQYAETLSAIGLQSQSQMVEIWASQDTGSWTILMSLADGSTCVVAAGTGFESRFPNVLKEDQPAS